MVKGLYRKSIGYATSAEHVLFVTPSQRGNDPALTYDVGSRCLPDCAAVKVTQSHWSLRHLAHTLDEPAQRLDTWLKGPVFYDTDLRLLVQPSGDGLCFALSQDHDTREAIVAQWRPATARERLLEHNERT